MIVSPQQITGLVLAGGEGRRMGGLDKGLQAFGNEPLVAHALRRLRPQVGMLLISANRHLDAYRQFGAGVISDALPGFHGPLAGIHAGLRHCASPWLLTVPCDSPFFPDDLAQRLATALVENDAALAFAVTGDGEGRREHPVFSLIRTDLRDDLERYLHRGYRKVRDWQARVNAVAVPFDDQQAFRNLNTLAELTDARSAAGNNEGAT